MFRIRLTIAAVAVSTLLAAAGERANAQTTPKTPMAWTLEEAQQQLTLNPADPYLQYVALQLARNEGEQEQKEVAKRIKSLNRRRGGPDHDVDLFALFSAAHAIQETLQLDAMQADGTGLLGEMGNPAAETVETSRLDGPTVESHPWGKMLAAQALAGKQPNVSPLSACVPEDQYFVLFGSVEKLLQVTESGDRWGAHVLSQTIGSATTHLTSSRLKTQLAVATDPLTRPFYDMVVEEVAMTGSDLYFRTGSDTTLLFLLKQPLVFQARMDGFLDSAVKSHPDATRTTGHVLDVPYVHVATPDRRVCVFSAYPRPDLHVRSNSKAALQRVLAAILGKTPNGTTPVARLGESTEFKYIRTLMPRGAQEEDGFVYLSDPFIRRLVGPQLKLTSRRRMLCYNHLRMIGHGTMLFQTQYGRPPESLAEMAARGCAPGVLGQGQYRCPDGGRYQLADGGTSATCSHHGHAASLTPCREILVARVTEEEAGEYKQFLDDYNQYWRKFFDPIAIRIQVTPHQYRAETIILPLIDNSIYSGMAMALGGEPEPLDALPVPKRNIFSVVARWNKQQLAESNKAPFSDWDPSSDISKEDAQLFKSFVLRGIGNQIGMHVYDSSPTFDFSLTRFLGEMIRGFRGGSGSIDGGVMLPVSFAVASLNAPVYMAVPVEDAEIVDKSLERLDVRLAELARTTDAMGVSADFYQVPLAGTDDRIRCYSLAFGPVKLRAFIARIGDGLYLASKRFILEDLTAMEAGQAGAESKDLGPTAHAMVRIRPQHWDKVLPMFRLGWAEAGRTACLNNLGPLSSVARAVAATSGGKANAEEVVARADALHAVHFFCPDGGRYQLSPDGKQIVCGKHGTAIAPRQEAAPSPNSPISKLIDEFDGVTMGLTFLEDGLHAVVTIERK